MSKKYSPVIQLKQDQKSFKIDNVTYTIEPLQMSFERKSNYMALMPLAMFGNDTLGMLKYFFEMEKIMEEHSGNNQMMIVKLSKIIKSVTTSCDFRDVEEQEKALKRIKDNMHVLYDCGAYAIFSENEDPKKLIQSVHDAKVELFKKHISVDSFFLWLIGQTPTYPIIYQLYLTNQLEIEKKKIHKDMTQI